MKILALLRLRFLPVLCDHDYSINGWSSVKCEKCGHRSSDSKIYNQVFDGYLEKRTEGMRKAGFSDEYIYDSNSKIHP